MTGRSSGDLSAEKQEGASIFTKWSDFNLRIQQIRYTTQSGRHCFARQAAAADRPAAMMRYADAVDMPSRAAMIAGFTPSS